jgi:hypothetical protein
LKLLKINKAEYSRTFQYSYLASGSKYRASCKLASTNNDADLMFRKPFKATFNGSSFSTYSGDLSYMTLRKRDPHGDESVNANNPLIAPFIFLTRCAGHPGCVLRFTDVISLEVSNQFIRSTRNISDGLLEVLLQNASAEKKRTEWKMVIDKASDSFCPSTITKTDLTSGSEFVYRLLDYTNLGSYQFPRRIQWTASSYPPTSPPRLLIQGTVIVTSASIPDQIDDSMFNLDSELKEAKSVWDMDQKTYIRMDPNLAIAKVQKKSARNVLLVILLITVIIIPIAVRKTIKT